MKELVNQAMSVKQLSQRLATLESEVEMLKKTIEDLKAHYRKDDTGPSGEEDDGSWYSNHGHGD